jgi:YD repeat-containing protein
MMQSGFIRSMAVAVAFFLVATLLAWPASMQADQAQYFYDERGRLVAVIDGQGNVAVYTYDEVGNLISIQRFTSTGGGTEMGSDSTNCVFLGS